MPYYLARQMRNCCSILLLLILASGVGAQQKITFIRGFYSGKNVFLTNPKRSSGIGKCIDSIWVNGTSYPVENSSALEIRLTELNIELESSLQIKIWHQSNCIPKTLFQSDDVNYVDINRVSIDSDYVLSWTSVGLNSGVCFVVEQFKWNKWIELSDTCISAEKSSAVLTGQHSGVNRYRVKSESIGSGGMAISESIELAANIPAVMYLFDHQKQRISFSASTAWEVYDSYGVLKMNGYSDGFDCSSLIKGRYYLNYDNQMTSFDQR